MPAASNPVEEAAESCTGRAGVRAAASDRRRRPGPRGRRHAWRWSTERCSRSGRSRRPVRRWRPHLATRSVPSTDETAGRCRARQGRRGATPVADDDGVGVGGHDIVHRRRVLQSDHDAPGRPGGAPAMRSSPRMRCGGKPLAAIASCPPRWSLRSQSFDPVAALRGDSRDLEARRAAADDENAARLLGRCQGCRLSFVSCRRRVWTCTRKGTFAKTSVDCTRCRRRTAGSRAARPSRALFTNCGSAMIARTTPTRSACPAAITASAASGVITRPV